MKTKSILLAFAMALCIATGANAQETKQTEAVTVATVNIYNAALANQASNGELTIAFELNNREGIQSNIKYAVNLIQQTENKSILMDQKVYDEKITLGQEETKEKKITYTPPYFLNGTYKLMVEARNSDGLILGMADAGDVLLSGSGESVTIFQDTCYITVEGEDKHYTLTQGVDIKPEENIYLNCQIENNTKADTVVTPNFITYYRTTFGKQLDQQVAEPVSLKKGEKTFKKFLIPKQTTSQAYDAVFSLQDESSNPISEKVTAHYVIAGQSASIHNVQFDKSSYEKNEIAKLSFYYSGSANNFPNSRLGQTEDKLSVEINITDQKNKACVNTFTQQLGEESFQKLDIKMDNTCQSPKADVTIKDKDGKILAQSQFGTSQEDKQASPTQEETKTDFGAGARAALVGAAVLALVVLIGVFFKKGKKSRKAMIWLFAFVVCGLAMGEGAKGDTFSAGFDYSDIDCYRNCDTPDCSQCQYYFSETWTVNLNKAAYSPSETINVSSSARAALCANAADGARLEGTIAGSKQLIGNNIAARSGSYLFPLKSWTAQSISANYNAFFEGTLTTASSTMAYNTMNIPYTVTAPATNGSCGSANGGSYASKPTAGLCNATSITPTVTGSGPWTWTCTGSSGGLVANCSASKTATCTVTSWSPAASTVCSGESFTQTNNCGGTRSATGTKSCPSGCTVSSWSPDPSTYCSGTSFTQTSNCSTTRSATGTKDCCTPDVYYRCSYSPPLNDQICDKKTGSVTVIPTCQCEELCGGSCPTNVTLDYCRSDCSPKVVNCSVSGKKNLPGGYEEVAP